MPLSDKIKGSLFMFLLFGCMLLDFFMLNGMFLRADVSLAFSLVVSGISTTLLIGLPVLGAFCLSIVLDKDEFGILVRKLALLGLVSDLIIVFAFILFFAVHFSDIHFDALVLVYGGYVEILEIFLVIFFISLFYFKHGNIQKIENKLDRMYENFLYRQKEYYGAIRKFQDMIDGSTMDMTNNYARRMVISVYRKKRKMGRAENRYGHQLLHYKKIEIALYEKQFLPEEVFIPSYEKEIWTEMDEEGGYTDVL